MKKPEPKALFTAYFVKGITTVDGGWRITLDLGCNDGDTVVKLNKLLNRQLEIVVFDKKELDDA